MLINQGISDQALECQMDIELPLKNKNDRRRWWASQISSFHFNLSAIAFELNLFTLFDNIFL